MKQSRLPDAPHGTLTVVADGEEAEAKTRELVNTFYFIYLCSFFCFTVSLHNF